MSSAARQRVAAGGLPAQHLAWAVFLLPLLAVHGSLAIAIGQGHIEACNPYWDGCTSISRAGRSGDAILLFRATMLPFAALLWLYWWLVLQWLTELRPAAIRRRRAVLTAGCMGGLFLAIYVASLGEQGALAAWMRRTGINLFFGLTVLAQMLTAQLLAGEAPPGIRSARRVLAGLCAVMLVLGLASLPLQHFVVDRPALLNALEWQVSLLLICGLLVPARPWAQQQFRLQAAPIR